MAAMAHITVEPERPMLDSELRIRVSDLPPLQHVTIRSSAVDGLGRPHAAHATFQTDEAGAVDLARAAPIAGTYADADPMGLVWSMSHVPDATGGGEPARGILP